MVTLVKKIQVQLPIDICFPYLYSRINNSNEMELIYVDEENKRISGKIKKLVIDPFWIPRVFEINIDILIRNINNSSALLEIFASSNSKIANIENIFKIRLDLFVEKIESWINQEKDSLLSREQQIREEYAKKEAISIKQEEILIEKNKKENELLVIQKRLKEEPTNGNLHFDFALKLLEIEQLYPLPYFEHCVDSFEMGNVIKEFINIDNIDIDLIIKECNIALALGLSDVFSGVKTKYILINLLMVNFFKQKLNREYALNSMKALCREIISENEKFIKRNPYSMEALLIQRAAFVILQNKSGVGNIDIALSKVRSIIDAGLTNNLKYEEMNNEFNKKSDGIELENIIQKLLTAMELKANTTKATGDGGIDILAYSENPVFSGKYIVQCKDWKNPVGEPVIRDLFGVVMAENANKGIIITTGKFTEAAKKFAYGKQIELIDGSDLYNLINIGLTQLNEE